MPFQSVPFTWHQVDQGLAGFMLSDLAKEFGELARDDLQQIHYQNIGNGNGMTIPSERLEMHRLRTEELAARNYALYCEVWRCQQKPLSAEFLRAICPNRLRELLSGRVNSVHSEFSMEQTRTSSYNTEWLKAAMEEFRRSMDRLYARWVKLAEIDAKGLEYILAAAPNSPDADTAATQVVHARIQLRIVEARLASIEARITMCGRALSATQLRQPDDYRIKSLEQHLDGLKADKKQFEARQDEWQRSLDTALRRSAEIGRQTILSSLLEGDAEQADSESQLQAVEQHEQSNVTPEPNFAGVIGPEREVAQARERVRFFEAKIAAVDTRIGALQQAMTQAILQGSSTARGIDFNKAIQKAHADKKDLEFRRDDWQLMLTTASRNFEARQRTAGDCPGSNEAASSNATIAPTVTAKKQRATRPKAPCFNAAMELLKRNPKWGLLDFCRGMDAKAEQYPTSPKYKPPPAWKVRSFHEQYKKRSNTVSRFLCEVRKQLKLQKDP
jgi:hypothetical protein